MLPFGLHVMEIVFGTCFLFRFHSSRFEHLYAAHCSLLVKYIFDLPHVHNPTAVGFQPTEVMLPYCVTSKT